MNPRITFLFSVLLCLAGCNQAPLDPPTTDPLAYFVNSSADSGPGTLREALEQKQSHIVFHQSVTWIRPLTPLPKIDFSTHIDGSNRLVIVDGSSSVNAGSGFQIEADHKTIQLSNLTIVGFPQNGIKITNTTGDIRKDPAEGVIIQNTQILHNQGNGVHITNSDSVLIIESKLQENRNGIYMNDSLPAQTHCGDIVVTRSRLEKNRESGALLENLLRGTAKGSIDSQQHPVAFSALDLTYPDPRNYISENGLHGIWMKNSSSTMVLVSTNSIDRNSGSGVHMSHGSSSAFIGADGFNPGPTNEWANTISNNAGHGVWIEDNGQFDGSLNGIYISVSANTITQNQLNGIFLNRASSVLVGGVGVGTLDNPVGILPNVVSENKKNGIQISGRGLIAGKEGSFVWNTHILKNAEEAVLLDSGAQGNRIGNLDSVSIFGPAKRNKIHTISAQWIHLKGTGTTNNFVVGNEYACNSSASVRTESGTSGNYFALAPNATFYNEEAEKNYVLLQNAGFSVTIDYLNWLKSLFKPEDQTNRLCESDFTF